MKKCYRKRTPQLESLVISEYQNDPKLGTRGLAEKIGISRILIKQILKENNIKRKRSGLKQDFEEEKVDLIITLFKSCKNLKQIKDETGFSDGRIRKVIRENFKSEFSIYPDYNCIRLEQRKTEIIDMYLNKGETIESLAVKLNVGVSAIYRYMRKYWKVKPPVRICHKTTGIGVTYKNHFFRSLLELSFFISFIEKRGLEYESGEQEKYTIHYSDKAGKKRRYFPDFIIKMGNKKTIFECKPKSQWTDEKVLLKAAAARKFAKKRGMKYKILDCPLCKQEIKERFEENLLTFDDHNLARFQRFLNSPRNYPVKNVFT